MAGTWTRNLIQRVAQATLPVEVRRWLKPRLLGMPPVGSVDFGDLRRLTPISEVFGTDRGLPADRHYIDGFVAAHLADIRGRVLEVEDDMYTRRYGGSRVALCDVLHAAPGNPKATIVSDLSTAPDIADNTYDCIVLTQTIQYIYDIHGMVRTLHRILKPGGVLLTTCPGIAHLSRYDMDRWGEYWRFTSVSARRLFTEAFPDANLTIRSHGNVLSAIAFLHGLSAEELAAEELDFHDPNYELIITIRAMKPS